MHDTGHSGLVHWHDPEGWYGEGGGRRVQDGEHVIGYVGMMTVLDEGYISNVAVSPEHRRRGIADMLLSYLHAEAEKLALSFVSLEVRASNTPAISLYAKHGYIEEGRRKNYYQKPREDAIIMTRRWENEI